MFAFFDPAYFMILAPAMLLAAWAQWRVSSAYAHAGRIPNRRGYSGAQAARRILDDHGLYDVGIEPGRGFLSDHYDPQKRMLRLSPDVYEGRSLAAVGIAAHEAGHAIQQAAAYGPLALRNGLVPLAMPGTWLAGIIFMIGLVLSASPLGRTLMVTAILIFSAFVAFQLVNLPVEYNASSRALAALMQTGILSYDEEEPVRRVLSAAALTYVAATLAAILQLVYLLFRSGLLGGRRDK